MTSPAVHRDSAGMIDELRPNACDIGVGGERTGSGFKGSARALRGTSGPLLQAPDDGPESAVPKPIRLNYPEL
jgi:hypothetical protein